MKKITLASCVLAASLSTHAELQPMSEFDLHNVTGQAGVDIGLNVELDIGEIQYVDTATATDNDGGSIVLESLHLGGANKRDFFGYTFINNPSTRIDEFTLRIDADSSGDLIISGRPDTGNFIDFSLSTGAIYTRDINGDQAARLVDSINMVGLAAGLLVRVSGDSNATTVLMRTRVAIEDMDIDASSNGLKLENVTITGGNYFEDIEQYGVADILNLPVVIGMEITNDGDGVMLDIVPTVMDIGIGDLSIGDGSIGRVQIDNLALNDMSVKISGHN